MKIEELKGKNWRWKSWSKIGKSCSSSLTEKSVYLKYITFFPLGSVFLVILKKDKLFTSKWVTINYHETRRINNSFCNYHLSSFKLISSFNTFWFGVHSHLRTYSKYVLTNFTQWLFHEYPLKEKKRIPNDSISIRHEKDKIVMVWKAYTTVWNDRWGKTLDSGQNFNHYTHARDNL